MLCIFIKNLFIELLRQREGEQEVPGELRGAPGQVGAEEQPVGVVVDENVLRLAAGQPRAAQRCVEIDVPPDKVPDDLLPLPVAAEMGLSLIHI